MIHSTPPRLNKTGHPIVPSSTTPGKPDTVASTPSPQRNRNLYHHSSPIFSQISARKQRGLPRHHQPDNKRFFSSHIVKLVLVAIVIILCANETFFVRRRLIPVVIDPPHEITATNYSNTTTTTIKAKTNTNSKFKFDCAINWVRIPKTASTSMHLAYMKPIQDAKLFASTYLVENSCVFEPGGCSTYWYDNNDTDVQHGNVSTTAASAAGDASYFGIGQRTNRSNIPNITNFGRCFPKVRTFCYEYDQETHTMNFGPQSKMIWTMKTIKFDANNKNETISTIPKSLLTAKNEPYYITPTTSGHISLDTSLFGWILPHNPLIFAVFRGPLQRLISSFQYGISFGANRPGEVAKCDTGGEKRRHQLLDAINLARTMNDTSKYQSMLKDYLTKCVDASHNAYTRFFDPLTKNVNVAMNHLESHRVIIGLQDKLEETLQRWINITLITCTDHPDFDKLNHTLTVSFEENGKKHVNENKLVLGSGNSTSTSSTSYWPNIIEFDIDLQNLIRDCIKEDEVMYKRANELYEEQRDWFLY